MTSKRPPADDAEGTPMSEPWRAGDGTRRSDEDLPSALADDADLEAELGFEPAVAVSGDDSRRRPRRRSRRRLPRRIGAAAVLLGALASMGGAYAAFATSSGANAATDAKQQIAQGKQLFDVTCITCHGANLQGIPDQGVSLIGVGGAAVYFQVSTGRMPLKGQGPEAQRKAPEFTDAQTRALAAYVQSVGGGPPIPTGTLRGGKSTISDGGELFRLNCASCHGVTFKGAPLTAGKIAPALTQATDLQIYTAMLTGPEQMPVFSDNQITPEEKAAIIAYIQTIKASADPGGAGIDRIGPVSEAIVIWTAGVGFIIIVILWIGAKVQ
jgi:ubiquinol-cytochrome c reductase cytochrome c subunit